MAWLRQVANGHDYICFRFGGRRFKRSLNTKDERTVRSKRIRLEDSDDGFRTWKRSENSMTAEGRGCHEPTIVASPFCCPRGEAGNRDATCPDRMVDNPATPSSH